MKVWQPGRIGTLELDHRLIMGSMHLNLEGRDDHGASLAAFYAERARGGASLIVTGGLAVSRVGAGGRLYAMINEPDGQDAMAASIGAVHAEGAKIAAQLFHAGRYAFESSFGLRPVAPSAVYSRFSRSTPQALTEEEIQQTLRDFVDAARAAADLGFDAIEVMASEGYLINQFVSPLTNQRDDSWGGDAERRRAFPIHLLRMIKDACDLPVIFRISGDDLVPGSSSADEIADFSVALAAGGVDAINVGVGWHEAQVPTVQTLVPQGVWVPVAESIKDAVRAAGVDVPVIASNRINHVERAERVLEGGKIDFVSMARPFLADPRIVATSRSGRLDLVNTCIACNEACIDRSIGDAEVSCLVNPRAGREIDFPVTASVGRRTQDPEPVGGRRIVVIGGGPAGLEAARALASLGYRVVLHESEPELGGQFRLARQVPGKRDFGETVRYYTAALDELGVDVRLRSAVTDGAQLADVDAVVLATGVQPRQLELPGIDHPRVINYREAFADPAAIGPRVAIIGGGGIAVDLAHLLLDDHDRTPEERAAAFRAEWGVDQDPVPPTGSRHVTLMRRNGKVGAGMGLTTRWVVVGTIRHYGAQLLTGVGYRGITDDGVLIDTQDGARLIPADTVVIAAGQVPEDRLLPMISELGVPYRVIGGAVDTVGLNAVRATSQGLQAAYELHTELAAGQVSGSR
jgi:2,4-dienoyl-CoA reductase (NADPH2)